MEIASSPSNPQAAGEPPSGRLSMTPSLMPPPPEPSFVARQTERSLAFFEHVGVMWHMLVGSVRAGFRRPFEGRAIIKQLESLGVASV
ncbi:MAG TPA: ABC transporter permease, partial [Polyangiaceae bacterium]